MKVRLYFENFNLTGYENIKIRTIEDLTNLNNFDKGELDELIIDGILDYIPLDKIDETLVKLVSLIKKKGGKLIIIGTDAYEVAKAFTNYNIDIQEFNKTLFSDNNKFYKKIALSIITVSTILTNNMKLKVLKKRMNGFTYTVEAVKE